MKRILIILTQAIEYNTSAMIRCRNVMHGLVLNGYDVICYTPYPDEESLYYDPSIRITNGTEVRRYGGKPAGKEGRINSVLRPIRNLILNIYRKMDLFGSSIIYVKYWRRICQEIINEKFDVLISFSDPKPAHIMADKIKKRYKGFFYIQQWGDPLVADITNRSVLPKFVQKKIEYHMLSGADRICYVSPVTADVQKKAFPMLASRIVYIPTPCEFNLYNKTNNERIRLGYIGSYNKIARDIMPLYNAVVGVDKVELYVIGDTDTELEEQRNIRIISRVSHQNVSEYVADMDVLICIMNKTGTQIPGKIFNYAGTNKEIMIILDGDNKDSMREYFNRYNRFTFVDNNVKEISDQLDRYLSIGIPARQPVEDFLPQNVAVELVGER